MLSVVVLVVGYFSSCMSNVSTNFSTVSAQLPTDDSTPATSSPCDVLTADSKQDVTMDLVLWCILIVVVCILLVILVVVIIVLITKRPCRRG